MNLIEGVVVDTSDPQEMGRMKVWCPSIDGNTVSIETLPWVTYVSPLAGHARNYPAGQGGKSVGPVAYGFWAVPKVGATVLIGFLYGDYNQRIYLGSMYPDFSNRSLPVGRNSAEAPTTDSFDPLEPQLSNLKAQFGGNLTSPIARTRGAYERQAAQAADVKDGSEGYSTRVIKAGEEKAGPLDSQTYCITTPGRHSIIMQDDPKFARLRIKTAEGHQVIFDDANERIYVSTSKGRTWLEMDADGHISLYGAESFSVAAGGDINLAALGSVRIAAGKDIDLNAGGHLRGSACSDLSLSGSGISITSGAAMDILASGYIHQTGSTIHLNGPAAKEAPCAIAPEIVPSHEPWSRPTSKGSRGPNWKE